MANESTAEVTKADQQLINRFARLNARAEDLEADLQQRQRQLENARDALDELVLADEHVLVRAGDVLAEMGAEEASEWCERLKKQLEVGVGEVTAEVSSVRAEMASIKVQLYAKFGQNINLEYDQE